MEKLTVINGSSKESATTFSQSNVSCLISVPGPMIMQLLNCISTCFKIKIVEDAVAKSRSILLNTSLPLNIVSEPPSITSTSLVTLQIRLLSLTLALYLCCQEPIACLDGMPSKEVPWTLSSSLSIGQLHHPASRPMSILPKIELCVTKSTQSSMRATI